MTKPAAAFLSSPVRRRMIVETSFCSPASRVSAPVQRSGAFGRLSRKVRTAANTSSVASEPDLGLTDEGTSVMRSTPSEVACARAASLTDWFCATVTLVGWIQLPEVPRYQAMEPRS